MTEQKTISIIGASGYSGAELLKILSRHRGVAIGKLFANSSAGRRLDDVNPGFKKVVSIELEGYEPGAAAGSDLVFIALPSGEAMKIVPELLEAGKQVIDLGGDFRLSDAGAYESYYKRSHTAADLLPRAVYGIPEWNRAEIRDSRLIANPGCYPTSAILPLVPLLREGIVNGRGIIINSMSGTSGAGRASSAEYSFSEVNETVRAYRVGDHQHIPEIRQALEAASGREVTVTFTPHLIPITRGIYTSAYASLLRDTDAAEIEAIYEKYYGTEPFIRFSGSAIPEIKNVLNTNCIDIGFHVDPAERRITILSAIDNLVKGAAGQAVQNMNILFGYDETEGLR
jgi:N-acetyl-gamma-glutamyl-phosphate reductase